MRKTVIGDSGKPVSVIGMGCWGIGGATKGATSYGDVSSETAGQCISAALDAGVNFFDTSSAYGESEVRLGQNLNAMREKVTLATKGGLATFQAKPDFSPRFLKSAVTTSLKRLNTNYIDIYQLHNPPVTVFEENKGLDSFLDSLLDRGLSLTNGVSVKAPHDVIPLLEQYPFKTVQLNLNMMDVRSLDSGVLDYCYGKNVSVLARTPLCFGFLALSLNKDTDFHDTDHRSKWSKAQIETWVNGARELQSEVARLDTVKDASPASRAIRFCLSHPAVKVVLTGGVTPTEVTENALAGCYPSLPEECLVQVKEIHRKHAFFL